MEEEIKPYLKNGNIISLIIYFFMTFLGGGILIIAVAVLYCARYPEVPKNEIFSLLSGQDIDALEQTLKAYYFINSVGNFLSYLVLFIAIIFFMQKFLIEDAKQIKENYKRYLWLIPLLAGACYGISILIELLVNLGISEDSVNQNDIVGMILEGSPVLVFFSAVIFAPLVEELIYRKGIFSLLKKKPIWISYLVSGICFMLPHMLTSIKEFNFGQWILLCIPYLSSGLLLCATYHLSGNNIYASWFAHLINNFISFLLICAA